jgi:dGTP triphosphohydrolase
VIRDLFKVFLKAATDDVTALPVSMREARSEGVIAARATADLIAGLSENQAAALWRRVTGIASGSVTESLLI